MEFPEAARGESGLVVGLVSGSHFVNHMYLVILPPLLTVLSDSFAVGLAALGAAMGAQALVNTVCQLPYGYLSDTRSRTLVLAVCLGLGTLGVALVALAPSYEWLLAGQVVVGLGVAGHHPAHFPLLSDATPEGYRGRAFSVHGFAGNLGFGAASALTTAVLAAGYSWRHALGLVAALGGAYGLVVVLALWTRVGDDVTRPGLVAGRDGAGSGRSRWGRFRARVGELAGTPAILALAVVALVSSTAAWGVTSYAAVLLTSTYGVAPDVANLALTGMFAASAVMILVGGALADRIAPGPVMVASFGLASVVVAVIASEILAPLAAVAAVVLVGAVRSPAAPARSTLADCISARADLGQNFAVVTIGIMLGSAIAPPAFGLLIERAGYRAAFLGVAGVALVALGVTLWVLRRYGSTFDVPGDSVPTDD